MDNNILSVDELQKLITSRYDNLNKFFNINVSVINTDNCIYSIPTISYDDNSNISCKDTNIDTPIFTVKTKEMPLETFSIKATIPNEQNDLLNIFNINAKKSIISSLLYELDKTIINKIFEMFEPYKIHYEIPKFIKFLESHPKFYKILSKIFFFIGFNKKCDNYVKSYITKIINKHPYSCGTILPSINILTNLLELPETKTDMSNNTNIITYKRHKIISPEIYNIKQINGFYILPNNLSINIIFNYNPNNINIIENNDNNTSIYDLSIKYAIYLHE